MGSWITSCLFFELTRHCSQPLESTEKDKIVNLDQQLMSGMNKRKKTFSICFSKSDSLALKFPILLCAKSVFFHLRQSIKIDNWFSFNNLS